MGPFTYVGKVFNNPSTFFGIGGNNHHAFFDFNGKTYFTYHAQTLTKALGFPDNQQGYRSTHMEEVSYDSSGHINTITGTWGGVSQVKNLNPYVRTEAETLGWSKGINTAECSETGFFVNSLNMKVVNIQSGDWTAVSKADLGTGAKTFAVKEMCIRDRALKLEKLHMYDLYTPMVKRPDKRYSDVYKRQLLYCILLMSA